MSTKKNEAVKFTTPRFSALWCKLDKPDTKFNEKGVYSVKAKMNPENPKVQEFLAFLDEQGKVALDKAREVINQEKNPGKRKQKLEALVLNPPYEQEYDENGEETGWVLVNLKTSATYTNKDGEEIQRTIPMCDAHRVAIDATATKIGNGSTLCVKGTVGHNYVAAQNKAYVTLYINAVQLIKLVEYEANSFDGFEEEEDGYYGTGSSETSRKSKENTVEYEDEDGNTHNDTFGEENNGDF